MVLKKLFKLLLSALLVGAKMNFKKYHPIISETEAEHSIDRHVQKLKRKSNYVLEYDPHELTFQSTFYVLKNL